MKSRFRTLPAFLVALALVVSVAHAAEQPQATSGHLRIYVGTYTSAPGQGINVGQLDLATGGLRLDGVAAETKNPSFLALHPNRRFLYAVGEISDFAGQTHRGRQRLSDRAGHRPPGTAEPTIFRRRRTMSRDRRSDGTQRAGSQLRGRQRLGAADSRGRQPRGRDGLCPARGIERRSAPPAGAARPLDQLGCRKPFRLCRRPGTGQDHDLPLRSRGRHAGRQ